MPHIIVVEHCLSMLGLKLIHVSIPQFLATHFQTHMLAQSKQNTYFLICNVSDYMKTLPLFTASYRNASCILLLLQIVTYQNKTFKWQTLCSVQKMFWWNCCKEFKWSVNSSTPWTECPPFGDIFKCIFMNERFWFSIQTSLKPLPKGLTDTKSTLARVGMSPSSEPLLILFA